MVGSSTADDAGVYRLSDELALIQTVDFFTPIVDDPYTFGQIAAANALSDVYAMGGKPITALNLCGFPLGQMDKSVFREILRGGQERVHKAGAALCGGHSVEDPELKYGLSVTGIVHPGKVITNAGLRPGQQLILTKPLGTGIIATALKNRQASPEAVAGVVELMIQLNDGGCEVMQAMGVSGATDITGFGLLGHAREMARASRVGMLIRAARVPVLDEARTMAAKGNLPGGLKRNRAYCSKSVRISGQADQQFMDILVDAQTSGGLLMGVEAGKLAPALEALEQKGCQAAHIGEVREDPGMMIEVVF
jgi:selenide,water dikinase